MGIEPWLSFFNSRVLGELGGLEQAVASLQSAGYQIIGRTGGQACMQGSLGTAFARSELRAAYDRGGLSLEVSIASSAPGLEPLQLSVDMNWGGIRLEGEGTAHVSATTLQTPLFLYQEYRPEHYAHLLAEFGKALYEAILPDFGWIDISEPAGHTWFDDVRERAIPHLYWATFFGKTYVEKWGRRTMLTAPAWAIQELGDGGILLLLSPAPGWSSVPRVSVQAIERHLGGG